MITALLWLGVADARKPKPAELTIEVLTTEGLPLSTAIVLNSREKVRHRVNGETGRWTESVIYADQGEVPFVRGMELKFEVSAPGYLTETVYCTLEKKQNQVTVRLEKLDFGG